MADDFVESLKKDFVKKAIYDVTKFLVILILAQSISLVASKLLTVKLVYLAPYKWYIGTIFSCIGFLTVLYIYRKADRFRPDFPRLDFDYQVVEKDIYYEYTDRAHMTYRKKVRVKALKNGLDTFRDKYRWTGKGGVAVKSGVPEHQITETFLRSVWQVYEVRFGRTLKKGDMITTECIWELEDKEGMAVPFFSATIEEPTDLLRFNLCLNTSLGVREVICETSSGISSGKPLDTIVKQMDKHGEVTWEIRKPKLLYHYEMKWSMTRQQEVQS